MNGNDSEKIILTPLGKTATSTTLQIERTAVTKATSSDGKVYEGGGDHRGIVVNKVMSNDIERTVSDAMLRFRVFLVDGNTGDHTQEDRTLQFWFKPQVPPEEHASMAQEFFKELVSPQHFPRDYVGFIKMLMKLMQNKYLYLKKILIELRQVEKTDLPERPPSTDESILEKPELTEHRILELIESAYPNPVMVEDLAKEHNWPEEEISAYLENLRAKGLVKALDHLAFTRIIHNDSNLQIVKQMPTIISSKQPTIAIITAQYYEKLAVDAMIENKETFVRYTTVGGSNISSPNDDFPTSTMIKPTRFGESNVYTLGNIGHHRVVSTKLPTVGYSRDAFIAAGNTTTRLLGTFQMVDYVFVVGVGGGVPHYTDYTKHVRLGDVVVSKPALSNMHAYSHCSNVIARPDGKYEFEAKNYRPLNPNLQDLASHLKLQFEMTGEAPWMQYMKEGQGELGYAQSEHDFTRPSQDTDKLYMPIGERDVIEVAHPTPLDDTDASRLEGCPRVHLGPVASGREVSRNAKLREAFSREVKAVAWDSPSDTVVESIVGNCRDSWSVIRGIADYRDGSRRSPWQAYSSLAAAAVVKAIICALNDQPLGSP